MKTAMITGITGQDGCYLSKLLLKKDYKVVGLLDGARHSSMRGLEYVGVLSRVDLRSCDLSSSSDMQRLVLEIKPDEIYHLASQSSVADSFRQPALTMHANTLPVINILETIRTVSRETRMYHASSSEMYGKVDRLPVYEATTFHPISPYAVSKVAAHQTVRCYRESYGLFAVSGILFNHESVLRGEKFFTRKLICQALEVKSGRRRFIRFGNLDVRRDIGYAPHYVEAMWKMLQHDHPYDFIICSGESVSLRELVEHVFMRLELPLSHIQIQRDLFRPNEIADIYGSNAFAREKLDWNYGLTAFDVIDLVLKEEMESQQVLAHRGDRQ